MSDRGSMVADLSPEERARLFELLRRRRAAGSRAEPGGALETATAPPSRMEGDRGPLSFAQERLWFLDRMDPGNPVYNMPERLRLGGGLSVAALAATLAALAARHEVLRTRFTAGIGRGGPVQEILPAPPPSLPVVDLSGLPVEARRRETARVSRDEARRPFDLAFGPLFRAALLRTGARLHVLLLTVHHAVSDGWSRGLLLRDLAVLYGAFAGGGPAAEEPGAGERLRYLDWSAWQRRLLATDDLDGELAWWRERLAGVPHVMELPADRPRPAVQRFRGRRLDLELPDSAGWTSLARRLGTTPFTVLLAAFALLLSRWSGRRRFVVGTPVAGRNRPEARSLVGLFVNTLPLALVVDGGGSFVDLVARIHGTAVGAFEHQEIPFERLVEAIQPERSADRGPLVQVTFALQNAPAPPLALPGLDVAVVETDPGVAHFDLTLSVAPSEDGGLVASFEHDRDLFDRTTIERLARSYRRLLAAVLADPQAPCRALASAGQAERHHILHEWNDTGGGLDARGRPVRESRDLTALFDAVASERAEAVAVAAGDGVLTYGELRRRSERLAGRLRRAGVGAEARVGLALERSAELVTALLGVLRAGAAYVPLDVDYPAERLRMMVEDAELALVVTAPGLAARLPATGVETLVVDGGQGEEEPAGAAVPENPERLAYVMYTSGSTGRPKGVAVAQRGVVRLVRGSRYVEWGPDEVLLGISATAFDASTFEVWGALLHGARLELTPPGPPSLEALGRFLAARRVSLCFLTAGLFHQMVERQREALAGVRQVITGGDVVSPRHAAELLAAPGDRHVVDAYGPTESTTFALTHRVEAAAAEGTPPRPLPIGRPIADTRAWIADASLSLVPVGAPGELLLGGSGLARGYLGRPAHTAERFVPDPWSGGAGARLYRTGDRASVRPDGSIDFHGRLDRQLKVRGFRIEAGEVEAALDALPEVVQSVVDRRDDALVAWIEPATGGAPEPAALRRALAEALPEYMVPSRFMAVAEMPLTAHGKIDRRRLPEPGAVTPEAGYREPRNELERTVCEVFAELLERERVGLDEDFFDLGGHSLLATQLVTELRLRLGVELPLQAVFEAPRPEALADRLSTARLDADAEAAPGRLVGDRGPLSFAQERLWFLDRLYPGNPVYNMPERLRLAGDLSVAALAATLAALAARHEVLRTRFPAGRWGDEPIQEILPARRSRLPVVDLAGLPDGARRREMERVSREDARRPFDLASGLLFRATLLRTGARLHVLLLTVHHAVSDGWSRGLLLRDLAAYYGAFAGGGPEPAAPGAGERLRYLDWSAWQRRFLAAGALEPGLAWWRERLEGVPRVLELPTDRPRPVVQRFRGRRLDLELPDSAAGAGWASLARRLGTTPFTVLLSAFALLLARWSGRRRFVVGTPVAGRNRPETRSLVGLFVNTLPLAFEVGGGDERFAALVDRAHRTAMDAFEHQEIPFERLVEAAQPERAADRGPLVQVTFALQNAPTPPLALPGLEVAVEDLDPEVAHFDLTVSVAPSEGGGLVASFENDRDLFDRTTIERLARSYRRLLSAVLADPRAPCSALPGAGAAERHLLLHEWNDTRTDVAPGAFVPVHAQVAARAAEDPEAPAVVWLGGSWTYGELVGCAGALATRLRRLGVGPENVVGVLTGPGPGLVLGALAVLEAGGAYLPLDPSHPAERLRLQLADAGATVLLHGSGVGGDLAGFDGPIIEPLGEEDGGGDRGTGTGPEIPAAGAWPPERLAYMIYTSGSTGRPKGVAVSHGSLAHLVAWYRRRYRIRRGDRGSQLAGVAFDASVWEVWGHLVAGASLHLAGDEERLSPPALLAWLDRHAVTHAFVPTPAAELLLREEWPRGMALRVLLTGGDRLHRPPAPGLPATLVNHYGPTEATVVATAGVVAPVLAGRRAERSPDIGRPIDRLRIHLLAVDLRPVPLGAPAEIYLGGAGLARGYRGRPRETAESFVPDPFAGEPGGRLYRTGDLGRHLADGRVAFHGRRDGQLEVRGLRLEPGEVEACLIEHPAVAEAVVLPTGSGEGTTGLAAFVTAAGDREPVAADLAAHLRRRLPEWMVPARFTVVPELPLTASGKVDRAALAALPVARPAAADAVAEPRDEAERQVAAAWREVLDVAAVAPDDNFFDLGGHSLLLVRLRDRLAESFGRTVDVVDLFRHPTVATQAAFLAAGRALRERPAPAVAPHARTAAAEPVAMVGLACRMPGAEDAEAFWRMLREGRDAATELDRDALLAAGVEIETLDDPRYVRRVPLLDDADRFDAGFFGVPPREAEAMDPQHRVFLECAWEALEDAGYDPARFRGAIGVWAGASLNDYLLHLYANPGVAASVGPLQAKVGIDKDFLATRAAYKLGLTGPAVTVQTACSTSLVAVHLARRALAAGECDLALAGGVSVRNLRREGYLHEAGGVLSPDGRCRAFDAASGGTVSGDGVGLVVLKRLSEARADGDRILALVRGSAINNDGSLKVGFTAPSPEGQAAVVRAALADAGVDPATVGYVEAHGTGTALGDPVEVAALVDALGSEVVPAVGRRLLGSVKSNVGHLDAAAGVAGLIKTVLALERGEIPPSLHFETPNPRLDLAGAKLALVTRPTAWPPRTDGPPRRAGVSSFGIGGTNAHVVVEEAPAPEPGGPSRPWQLLCLSARGPEALEATAGRLAARLADGGIGDLSDVAFTLSLGRRSFPRRRVVLADSPAAAVRALHGEEPTAVLAAPAPCPPTGVPVGFLFPGQGSPAPGATRALHAEEPAFRDSLGRCLELLAPHLEAGADLEELIHPPAGREAAAAEALRDTALAQPALFAVSYSLARLWESWGVRPAAMLGHSLGEYVAATLAGVLSLPDALALVAARGRWMQRMPPGAMLAVPLPPEDLEPRLPPGVDVAALNAPDRTVVSGAPEAIARLAEELEAEGVRGRRLATSHAFHSALVEPLVERWERRMAEVDLRPPRVPYLSSLTGTWIRPEEATDPSYWARHLRLPVRFAPALEELARRAPLLLEVGPGRALATLARRHPAASVNEDGGREPVRALASLDGDPPRPSRALARLWLAGVEIDWEGFWQGQRRHRVALPTYPFERQRYWLEAPRSDGVFAAGAGGRAERATPDREPLENWLYLPAWRPILPPAAEGAPAAEPGSCWLAVLPEGGGGPLAAAVVAGLGGEVVTVEASAGGRAEGAQRLAGGAWRLDAANDAGWRELASHLADRDVRPRRVLHLANLGDGAAPGSDPEEDLEVLAAGVDAAFHGPLSLVRALAEAFPGEETGIWLVADGVADVGGGEPVAPEKALLLGPAQVVPRELAHVRCRLVDLPVRRRPATEGALARQLLAELGDEEGPAFVALRSGHRFVRGFERVVAPAEGRARLRPGGVYLVTGGLGGIGLALADHLARGAEGARLILLGRSSFPEPARWRALATGDGPHATVLRRLAALEERGARVEVVSADVGDAAVVAGVVDGVLERHGALHGVIHAAGVAGGGVLLRKKREAAEAVLRPKVQGTLALHRALARRGVELDFFVLCSSLNSVLGVFGQVDYVAANAFEDAYAEAAAARDPARPPLSLAWDLWRDTGMAFESTGTRPGVVRRPTGHPLLGDKVWETEEEHAFCAHLSAADLWVLDEHRIAETPVLPGTAYLEMARAAFAAATGTGTGAPVEISEAVFLAPLRVPDGEAHEVFTVLRRRARGFDFEVASRDPTAPGLWYHHASGSVTAAEPAADEHFDAPWSRTELALEPVTRVTEAPAAGAAARYGPRWDSLRAAGAAAAEEGMVAGARLELPVELASDLEEFGLHPALLDVATGFATNGGDGEPGTVPVQLPFAYRRVVVHRPLPARFESRSLRLAPARLEGSGAHAGGGEAATGSVSFTLRLRDPAGRPLVSVERYTLRRFEPAAGVDAALPDLAAAGARATAAPDLERIASGTGAVVVEEGMTTAEGVEVFRRALAVGAVPRLLASTTDLAERAARMEALTAEAVLEAAAELAGATPTSRHRRPDLDTPYAPPGNETEEVLAEIWQELLGIDRVGLHDDFFELGGDSVLGLRIAARAREAGFELDPGELFERPTVAELARAAATHAAPAPDEPAAEDLPTGREVPVAVGGAPSPEDFPDAELSEGDLDLLMNRLRSLDQP